MQRRNRYPTQRIHDRMPAILVRRDHDLWLGSEPDPHDLLVTFPAGLMRIWPISKRVNKPENDDPRSWSRSNQMPSYD